MDHLVGDNASEAGSVPNLDLVVGLGCHRHAEIDRALALVAQRRVEAVIGARFDLADVAGAYRVMQSNGAFGRIVVDVG